MGSVFSATSSLPPSTVTIYSQPEKTTDVVNASTAQGAIVRVGFSPSAWTSWGLQQEVARLHEAFHIARQKAGKESWEDKDGLATFPPWCVPVHMKDGSFLLHCIHGHEQPRRCHATDSFQNHLSKALGGDCVVVISE
jgi:hypothetical protein